MIRINPLGLPFLTLHMLNNFNSLNRDIRTFPFPKGILFPYSSICQKLVLVFVFFKSYINHPK